MALACCVLRVEEREESRSFEQDELNLSRRAAVQLQTTMERDLYSRHSAFGAGRLGFRFLDSLDSPDMEAPGIQRNPWNPYMRTTLVTETG